MYVTLPAEDPRGGDLTICCNLKRTMYGTLDAAQRWPDDYTGHMIAAGFLKGTAVSFLQPNPKHPRVGTWKRFRLCRRRRRTDVVRNVVEDKFYSQVRLNRPGCPCSPRSPHPRSDHSLRVMGDPVRTGSRACRKAISRSRPRTFQASIDSMGLRGHPLAQHSRNRSLWSPSTGRITERPGARSRSRGSESRRGRRAIARRRLGQHLQIMRCHPKLLSLGSHRSSVHR